MINKQNYQQIIRDLEAYNGKLIAVSKTKPIEAIEALYKEGQKFFGENYVQELVEKQEQLPKDLEWHFIGHLQSKKAKLIAPFVSCIHSVDSWKLLKEIDKRAKQHNRIIDCLLQFHIAEESTKFGLDLREALEILKNPDFKSLNHIRITGVMGMATFTNDKIQVQREFKELKAIFEKLKEIGFDEEQQSVFQEISMGMSGDYQLALKEGSTMVRVGSLLFGGR